MKILIIYDQVRDVDSQACANLVRTFEGSFC